MNVAKINQVLEDYKPIEVLELLGLDDTEKLLEALEDYVMENTEEILENFEVNGVV
jgi:hypothetical protein